MVAGSHESGVVEAGRGVNGGRQVLLALKEQGRVKEPGFATTRQVQSRRMPQLDQFTGTASQREPVIVFRQHRQPQGLLVVIAHQPHIPDLELHGIHAQLIG